MSSWVSFRLRSPKEGLKDPIEAPRNPSSDPIKFVQVALTDPKSVGPAALITALDEIVELKLWLSATSASGSPFDSFAEFAVASAPHGLGVRCQVGARLVRHALFEGGHLSQWTDLLEKIARKPGRPTISTNSDDYRFYTVSRAKTSRDRLLLALKREYHEYYCKVCEGQCSPYRAALDAGLVEPNGTTSLWLDVHNHIAAKKLKNKKQARVLRDMFRSSSLDAQCALLANVLDPHLGPDLAKRWRMQHAPSGSSNSSGS